MKYYSDVASKYKRADNVQNLYNLWTSAYPSQANMISWPSNAEYYVTEGEKLYIIDYTDTYVYYWSPGYKSFSGNSLYNCDSSVVLESHPAGFYKIKRDYVWMDIYGHRDEILDEMIPDLGSAQALRPTVAVYQQSLTGKFTKCYAIKQNDELRITNNVPYVAEDGTEYYCAQFKGKTAVGYFDCGYYNVYVKKNNINFYDKNVDVPKGYSNALIKGVKDGYVAKVYSTKVKSDDYRVPGDLASGAKVKVYTDKSDADWACIWLNNDYAYLPAKFIEYYVGDIVIKDVVDGKYVISWGKIPAKVMVSWTGGTPVTYAVNKESITLGWDVFKGREVIELTAQAEGSSIKSSKRLYYPANPFTLLLRSMDNNTATFSGFSVNAKHNGAVLEYSTNKDFKNAKKAYPTGNFYTVKNLKKNTTYYFRYYNSLKVKTENGQKTIKGQYSNVIKKKTTNITISKPTWKSVKGGKKNVTLKWKITSKKANKTEIVIATNKNFSKNVIKGELNKKFTEYTWPNLKAKTTYYVKIRTEYYDSSSRNTYYSGWSTVKSFKTK